MGLLEFLAVGAWGFWLLLAISAIITSELTDNDSPGWATITAIGTVAALAVLGDFNPIELLKANPLGAVYFIAAYFVAGTAWSVTKWFFWLRKARAAILEMQSEFPSMDHYSMRTRLRERRLPIEFPPKAGDHKGRIIGWMALWPASMVWTMINDPVRSAFETIYDSIGGALQGISNKVFKDVSLPPTKD